MTPRDTRKRLPGWLRRLLRLRKQRRQRRNMPAPTSPAPAALAERLDAIEQRLAAISDRLPASSPDLTALPQAVAALGTQINRAGREQLKANALVESYREQLTEALAQLREAQERLEAEQAASAAQDRDIVGAARLDVIQRLLPALDGLDEAIRSGTALLDQKAAPPAAPPERPFLARVFGARLRAGDAPEADQATTALRDAMRSWLVGVSFVRQRLLDVLAAEEVRPMDASGRPFDPHLHVALEAAPATADRPAGAVAAELRRGYYIGDRVLRYAEVTVAANGAADQDREDAR